MRLLFLSNIPSPYMVDFFNELGKLCQLTVVFEKHTSSERDKSWENYKFNNFKGIILNGIDTDVDKSFCPQIIKYLKKNLYDHIIVTNPATPTGIIAIEYMKIRKIPYILESEGGFPKDGKGLKERFKRHLMSGASLYLSTTKVGDNYFLKYGAKKEKIIKYQFTSLFEKDLLDKPLKEIDKVKTKEKLNIKYDKMVISVGRFIHNKGYDVLLKACKDIDENIGIYIVGGIPSEDYLSMKDQFNLSNVHFLDFLPKEYLRQYYKAADLFVLPTREDTWGLVINEAMSCGLPIITTDRCIAGLELVINDENGYIVPIENEKALSDKINYILQNDKLREKMGEKSLEKIQWYTFEKMAKRHIEILTKMDY